jgi:hypothetical protein
MSMLQPMIEKKLSELFGSAVRFERMKFSVFSGSVDAYGMTVAGESPDRPLLKIGHVFAEMSITKALSGQLVIKSAKLSDGEIHLAVQPNYKLDISDLKVDLNCQDNRTEFAVEANSIRRTDSPATIGPIFANGFAETADLTAIPHSPLELNFRGTPDLEGEIKSPGLADPDGKLEISGSMNFLLLMAFLPFRVIR